METLRDLTRHLPCELYKEVLQQEESLEWVLMVQLRFATLFFVLLLALSPNQAFAQSDEGDSDGSAQGSQGSTESKDVLDFEKDIEQNLPTELVKPDVKATRPAVKATYHGVLTESQVKDFSIIQRNYMPKTSRWQASGYFTFIPSDVFYKPLGISARIAYHFTERWGLEINESSYNPMKGDELKGLEDKQHVSLVNQSTLKNLLSADLYFNQMYGKFALRNRSIIPFEFYNLIGLGVATDQNNFNGSAFTIGMGEMFSMSRSSALRVELKMTAFESKTISGSKTFANLIFLNIGYSRFFPEPDYR